MIARGSAGLVFSPVLAMVAVATAALGLEDARLTLWSLPLGVAFLFLLAFFRDPERQAGAGIVSPADGRVLEVDPYRGKVAVFMALRNVHVNRAPLEGRVSRMTYTPGGHARAYTHRAVHNERLEMTLDTVLGQVKLLQVAGVFARRIVPYVREGDKVKKGQRIGMIRFGSRVEVTLPKGVRLVVRRGDRVRAGETSVAGVPDALDA